MLPISVEACVDSVMKIIFHHSLRSLLDDVSLEPLISTLLQAAATVSCMIKPQHRKNISGIKLNIGMVY